MSKTTKAPAKKSAAKKAPAASTEKPADQETDTTPAAGDAAGEPPSDSTGSLGAVYNPPLPPQPPPVLSGGDDKPGKTSKAAKDARPDGTAIVGKVQVLAQSETHRVLMDDKRVWKEAIQ